MLQLTTKELCVKKYMLNTFVPALNDYLKKHNPGEYARWEGNCCRQAAIFGLLLLKKLLPEHQWQAWDGTFREDLSKGRLQYDHAWIYGQGRNYGIFVDISRTEHQKIFMAVSDNRYPALPDYWAMKELDRRPLDLKECLDMKEFYTRRPAKKVFEELVRILGPLDIAC